MDNTYLRIRQLPENMNIKSTDYLVIDNEDDTWKVRIDVFNLYIKDLVQDKFDTDISSVINEKVTEIHLDIKQTEELIKTLNEHIVEFEKAEQDRDQAEKDREVNESIRQQFYDDNNILVNKWKDDEQARKDAEQDRVDRWADWESIWNEWVATHTIWTNNENDRKLAETNRGLAETDRQAAESARASAETNRQNAESNRVSEFNGMVNYFNNIKDSIDEYIKEGTTVPITPDDVVQILEFAIPADSGKYFTALVNINKIFVGVTFIPVMNNGTTVAINVQYYVPSIYSNFDPTEVFKANYKIQDNVKIISVEYKPVIDGSNTHVVGIWYDNLSRFRPTDSPIYSKVVNQAPVKANFSIQNISVIDSRSDGRVPDAFISLIERIIKKIDSEISSIKPYVSYPVGSIYQTTSPTDPSILLGGGKWKLLYGDGISEGLTSGDTVLYSPTIYTWERIS